MLFRSVMGTHAGRRVVDGTEPHLYHRGDYGEWQGHWYGRTPDGLIANLKGHEIVVHADRTISVNQEIKTESGPRRWHGWLEHGIWKTR